MTDAGSILSYVADSVVVVGAAVGLYAWLSGRFRRHEEAHLVTDTGVALLLSDIAGRNQQLRTTALELVGQIARRDPRVGAKVEAWEKSAIHGNPLTSEEVRRRRDLSRRVQAGETLPVAELNELLGILNKELEEAHDTAAAAVVVIGLILLIAVVVAAIAAASE